MNNLNRATIITQRVRVCSKNYEETERRENTLENHMYFSFTEGNDMPRASQLNTKQ